MTQVSATKKAFVRGIGEYLQRAGATKFPSPQVLRDACDKVASVVDLEEPVLRNEKDEIFYQNPSAEKIAATAQHMVALSNHLEQRGVKMASDPRSVSIASPKEALGDILLGIKTAMAGTGNTAHSMDPGLQNKQNLSPQVDTKMDDMRRPEGSYALVGQGNANFGEPAAYRVGQEIPHPKAEHGVQGAPSNSVVDASKAASIKDILSKLGGAGTGNTAHSMDPGLQNKQTNSPQADTILDDKRRPEGSYALVGQGNANFSEPAANRVGQEQKHPKEEHGVQGVASNSVTNAAKAAELVQKIAAQLMPVLPSTMSPEDKIATIRNVVNLEPEYRELYLQDVISRG